MEHNKHYAAAQALISKLEQQIALIEEVQLEQDYIRLRRQLEEHFERCIHALEVRQHELTAQLDDIFIGKDNLAEGAIIELKDAVHKCTEIVRTGALFFTNNTGTADHIWQGVQSMAMPNIETKNMTSGVQINLQSDLLNSIEHHGTVLKLNEPSSDLNLSIISASSIPASIPVTTSTPNSSAPTPTIFITPTTPSSPKTAIPNTPTSAPSTPTRNTTTPSSSTVTPSTLALSPPTSPAPTCTARASSAPVSARTPSTSVPPVFSTANPSTQVGQPTSFKASILRLRAIVDECNGVKESTGQGESGESKEMVTSFVGSTLGYQDGINKQAKFYMPSGVCINRNDNCLYVCDSQNSAIRKVTLQGVVSTFAKGVKFPTGIAINPNDNSLYVSNERFNTITKITASGDQALYAGDASGKKGFKDGIASTALFSRPTGLAIDPRNGDLYVADTTNNVIRVITPKGFVMTIAGTCEAGLKDGPNKTAQFYFPTGLSFNNEDHSLLVCDSLNNKIRRISLHEGGKVSTMWAVVNPSYVAVVRGSIIVTSDYQHIIIVITTRGGTTTRERIGTGGEETVDGASDTCSFNGPRGIAVDEGTNTCYVADCNSGVIRKILS